MKYISLICIVSLFLVAGCSSKETNVKGVVISSNDAGLIIKTEEGDLLNFNTENAKTISIKSIAPYDTATVFYTLPFLANISKAVVSKVIVIPGNSPENGQSSSSE